jgi:hypothetical protein
MVIFVQAKNPVHAKERAWREVSRMSGGDMCLTITVNPQPHNGGPK